MYLPKTQLLGLFLKSTGGFEVVLAYVGILSSFLPTFSKAFLVLYFPQLKHHAVSLISRDKQCKDPVLAMSFKNRSSGKVLVAKT